MQALDGLHRLGRVHDHGQADRRGGDGHDVDVVVAQSLERARGDARRRLHARAHQRHLRDVLVDDELASADLGHDALHGLLGAGQIGPGSREGDVGEAGLGHILDDHVQVHVGSGQRPEHASGHVRRIGHLADGHLHFRRVAGDAGNDGFFHFVLLLDIGSLGLRECGARMDDHFPFAGELHRAALQHTRAGAGELQHVVVTDGIELAGPGRDARVGGVDAVHIGVDLADVGINAPGDGHRRRVRPAATERGDVAVGVDALESGDHGNGAIVQRV